MFIDRRSIHPLYDRWRQMLYRCENPDHARFPDYGGRGITVCARWRNDFWAFVDDVGTAPMPGMSLDRIDNNGNYEPGNLRWATAAEQNQNKRPYRRRETCRRGHPVNEENTYVAKSGKHNCRPCLAARARRIRKANREGVTP